MFDLRENPDCIPFGLNVSEYCARGGCTIALLNCLDEDVPRNAGSLPPRRGAAARGLDRRRARRAATRPRSRRRTCSTGSSTPSQSAFCQLGEGQGLAEGAGAMGVGYAVFSGTYPRQRRAVRHRVRDRQQRRPGLAALRRLDHLRDARLLEDDLHRQRRDARAHVPAAVPLAAPARRLRRRRAPARRARPRRSIYGPRATPMRVFYIADYARHPARGVRGGLPRHGRARRTRSTPTAPSRRSRRSATRAAAGRVDPRRRGRRRRLRRSARARARRGARPTCSNAG